MLASIPIRRSANFGQDQTFASDAQSTHDFDTHFIRGSQTQAEMGAFANLPRAGFLLAERVGD
jgi:hypothetical protein